MDVRGSMIAKRAPRVVRRDEREEECVLCCFAVLSNRPVKKIKRLLFSRHCFVAFTPAPCNSMIFSKTTLTPMSTSGTPLPGRVDAPTK